MADMIHDSFPSQGEEKPAYEGSQSSAPNAPTTPLPKADPRGYDSTSLQRNFGKYPASFSEKAQALFGSYRQLMGYDK
jgi:hypothetical protein